MAKRSKKKKQSLFIKLANTVFTVTLAGIMAYGLQCYSAATSLKFAQVSDAHFYTGEDNSSLNCALNPINFLMMRLNRLTKPRI